MSKKMGIINLIKPPSMTSFAAVKWVKKELGVNKAGHTGTLDPAATGVLPICLERATKIIPFLPEKEKEYVAEIELGIITDTLDKEGQIREKSNRWQNLTPEDIKEVVKKFKGEIKQIPPMYSALRFKGKRLYELAREGKEIKREPRKVQIKEIDILETKLPFIRLRVLCSKGTYIRSLARDIGEELNTGAVLSFLIRTRSGPFHIDDALTLNQVDENKIIPPDRALTYPGVKIKDKAKKKAQNGGFLNQNDLLYYPDNLKKGDMILVYDTSNAFLSIDKVEYKMGKKIRCKPLRVFSR